MSERRGGPERSGRSDRPAPDGLDFEDDELEVLRQVFRGEAEQALDAIIVCALGAGLSRPSPAELSDLLRRTHALKGSGGTVGLTRFVELVHRLETSITELTQSPLWPGTANDTIVEIADGLRQLLHAEGPAAAAVGERVGADLALLAQALLPAPTPVRSPGSLAGIPLPIPAEGGGGLVHGGELEGGEPDESGSAELSAPPSTVRVEPERIDALMSSAGELLFDRTRIERRAQMLRTCAREIARLRQALHDALSGEPDGALDRAGDIEIELANYSAVLSQTSAAMLDEIEGLRRSIGEVQRGLNRIRMESARVLFLHAARTARALRRATGIAVDLRTTGEATEFDKTVAERLVDPIVQLVRNAIVHGSEPTELRFAAGKPAALTVHVRTRHEGAALVVEVADDGAGIDTHKLRDRYVAAGRWTAARAASAGHDDVLAALFSIGVSSRDDADELAGRGIGLDLVRESVVRLGGEVSVVSQIGGGATFTLRVPLSTAVTEATLFKVEGQVYAIPQLSVRATLAVDPGATAVLIGDQAIAVLALEQLLGGVALRRRPSLDDLAPREKRPALLVEFAGHYAACTVDKIVGRREIVIKPLGALLAPLTLYAGATISGSGKVQLILDPAQLVARAQPSSHGAVTPAGGLAVPGAAASPWGAPLPRGRRALVVDDSPSIREALTTMLAREGWIVDVADDGSRAHEMTQRQTYQLVITDLEMPGLSGFALIAALRSAEAAPAIIVLTSRNQPEVRRRVRDLGVAAFVAKPITRRKLLEAIEQARHD
jgi:chemosensory pili system protein ChpA (sensor histidine kinase/response regulator)